MDSSRLPGKNSAILKDNEYPPMFASRPAGTDRSTSGTQATEEENNARTLTKVVRHQYHSNNRPGGADEPGSGVDRHHPHFHPDRTDSVRDRVLADGQTRAFLDQKGN